MVEHPHLKFLLPERSYQAVVRSELKRMAESAGFTGHRLAEVEIIIAEITSNLVKYSPKGGMILARPIALPFAGFEMIAIDNGPGMSKPLKMMEDGTSTGKTLGQGLGAIRRLSDLFDLYSLPGWGTVLHARVLLDKKKKAPEEAWEVSVLNVCKKKEFVCGDTWVIDRSGKRMRIAVMDGLGHGVAAAAAAVAAAGSFRSAPQGRPSDQLRILHTDLKKTRGVVATIAYLDDTNNQIMYSGVGNITMKIISSGQLRGCLSYNGIVGHIMPSTLNDHIAQWEKRTDTLVMHSDGLSSRWDLQKYPNILQHSAMMLCGALYKDFDRDNDDSTVLVGKYVK